MTNTEFDKWWQAHRTAFMSIDAWLGKMPTDAERRAGNSTRLRRSEITESEVTQGDVMRQWRVTLSDVSLADALAVTTRMAKGDIDAPREWEAHARHVRKNVATQPDGEQSSYKPKGRLVDGEWVYHCGRCEDQGTLDIWEKDVVAAASRDPEAFLGTVRGKRHCIVACPCDEGTRMVQTFAKRKQFLPVYDERRMYLYEPGFDSSQKLVDAIFAASVTRGTEWTGEGQEYAGYDAFKDS
jgi:hypothetical protein